jgi:hypothetical protein
MIINNKAEEVEKISGNSKKTQKTVHIQLKVGLKPSNSVFEWTKFFVFLYNFLHLSLPSII